MVCFTSTGAGVKGFMLVNQWIRQRVLYLTFSRHSLVDYMRVDAHARTIDDHGDGGFR